jgi:hypothetical protein
MRFLVFLSFMTLSIHGYAEVGKVINLIGQDSYLIRADKKIPLQLDLELELADKVSSQNSVVVLYLAPSSQLSLSKNSEIQITESLIKEGEDLTKTDSIIDLIQGLIRLQVVGDSGIEVTQKIRTKDVSFGVRGTDFEVKLEEDEVSLDVYEGEVEVTSPHVNTFVPYYVKGSEGFRYGRKKHLFEKKKFSPRFREAGFKKREEIRERWQKRRNKIKTRKKLQGRRKMMKKTGRRQRTPRRKK